MLLTYQGIAVHNYHCYHCIFSTLAIIVSPELNTIKDFTKVVTWVSNDWYTWLSQDVADSDLKQDSLWLDPNGVDSGSN